MAYIDLANLEVDASFLARVGYAIGQFTQYIFAEDLGAQNHAARLNWALKATINIPAMVNSLIGMVCHDANVVSALGAVTDANLQTAVETTANNVILVPIGYADLMAMAANPTFLQRLQIAVAKFASYIMDEAPGTVDHPARYAWAKNALLNPSSIAAVLACAVAVDGTVSTNLLGTTDAQLQTALENAANNLLLS